MAFIDELISGGLPYGMEVEEPKAHDEINRLTSDNDFQNIAKDLVMGLVGGGGGTKALRAIKARNAKAIRDLTSGVTKGQKTLKPKDAEWLKNQMSGWEKNFPKAEVARIQKDAPYGEAFTGMLMGGLGLLKADAIERRKHGKRYGQGIGKLNIGRPPKQR